MKDHLGNNRVVADGIGTIVAVNDYDPYGSTPGEMENELTETDGSFTMDGTLWKYGGKERSESFRDYDFAARRYSTGLLRFTTMDPLAEKYYHLSPYAYCAGNPIRYVDPTGMEGVKYKDNNDNYVIESNIVILLETPIEIKENMTARERRKIERKNRRIERRNASFKSIIQNSLESIFSNGKDDRYNI